MKSYVFFLFLLLSSCGPDSSSKEELGSTNKLEQNLVIKGFNAKACQLDKLGLSTSLGNPGSINQAVDLINALPKPLTLPCFIQSLSRPLRLNATSSILSVQPAVGANDPRVFIFIGKLVMAISSAGDGKNLLEFSFMYNDSESLKGELAFPIIKNISYAAPFLQVETGGQSSCSGCHVNEVLDPLVTLTPAYKSIALKPPANKKVALITFFKQNYLCDFNNDQSYRCQMIRSLFENGQLLDSDFPAGTSTYFDSLGF